MNKMLTKLKKLKVIVDSLTPDETAELYNKSKKTSTKNDGSIYANLENYIISHTKINNKKENKNG